MVRAAATKAYAADVAQLLPAHNFCCRSYPYTFCALQIYDVESLIETHRELLSQTKMVDSVIETYPKSQVPDELCRRRDQVLAERQELDEKFNPVIEILEQEDVKELMDSARDREGNSRVLEHMQQQYSVSYC